MVRRRRPDRSPDDPRPRFDRELDLGQDPAGPFGGPLLDLRGRYPRGEDEVALTDRAADVFSADIGAVVDVDGRERTVVGLVENPSDLDDEFVLAPRRS